MTALNTADPDRAKIGAVGSITLTAAEWLDLIATVLPAVETFQHQDIVVGQHGVLIHWNTFSSRWVAVGTDCERVHVFTTSCGTPPHSHDPDMPRVVTKDSLKDFGDALKFVPKDMVVLLALFDDDPTNANDLVTNIPGDLDTNPTKPFKLKALQRSKDTKLFPYYQNTVRPFEIDRRHWYFIDSAEWRRDMARVPKELRRHEQKMTLHYGGVDVQGLRFYGHGDEQDLVKPINVDLGLPTYSAEPHFQTKPFNLSYPYLKAALQAVGGPIKRNKPAPVMIGLLPDQPIFIASNFNREVDTETMNIRKLAVVGLKAS